MVCWRGSERRFRWKIQEGKYQKMRLRQKHRKTIIEEKRRREVRQRNQERGERRRGSIRERTRRTMRWDAMSGSKDERRKHTFFLSVRNDSMSPRWFIEEAVVADFKLIAVALIRKYWSETSADRALELATLGNQGEREKEDDPVLSVSTRRRGVPDLRGSLPKVHLSM